MKFPPDWNVAEAADFDLALPSYQGEITVELLAQLRNTGRILDGFRFAFDGTVPLEINVDMFQLLPVDSCRGLRLAQQFWPRDIRLRRNMMTST
jgi:hypothetical protein